MKDAGRPTRAGTMLGAVFVMVALMVLVGCGAFMPRLWFLEGAGLSDGRVVPLVMSAAFWGMAALGRDAGGSSRSGRGRAGSRGGVPHGDRSGVMRDRACPRPGCPGPVRRECK